MKLDKIQLKEEYSKIAKKNQSNRGQKILNKTIRTDESVAKDLDMGKTTYRKAQYIYENGSVSGQYKGSCTNGITLDIWLKFSILWL